MNDLISRQEAMKAVEFFAVDPGDGWNDIANERNRVLEYVSDKIMHIPPVSRWIPVTERLPEESETIIASVDTRIYPEARFEDGRWWWALEAFADYWEEINKDVTAWMPLPEPYKEVKND